MKKNDLWYKDAVFYQVSVRAYKDSNGDGFGDLRGLEEKLQYIHELGMDCIWLMPIYPSPLRDDGYDIADYYNVAETYRNIGRFQVTGQICPCTRYPHHHGPCAESHLRRASVVPGSRVGQQFSLSRLLRLERYRSKIQGCPDHLSGYRTFQLDAGTKPRGNITGIASMPASPI